MNNICPSAKLLAGRMGTRLRVQSHHGERDRSDPGSKPAARVALPQVSRPLLAWFSWYSRRYLKRHFHSLRVSLGGLPPASEHGPVVVYANHASWWDALVWLLLRGEFFPAHTGFAPIHAGMLERYGIFRRLGFFGVEPHTARGAVQFLRTSLKLLESPNTVLAITPQGGFVDPRQRPVHFQAGLGHLASKKPRALFIPLALEYVYWEERLPEVLARFGEPVEIWPKDSNDHSPDCWSRIFEQKLTDAQDSLAQEAQLRRPGDFRCLLRGGAGQGGIYDLWQRLTSALRGETYRKEHGDK